MAAGSDFHSIGVDEALGKLGSGKDGLSEAEAEKRLGEYGANTLSRKHVRTGLDILAGQFRNAILWLLIAAAGISYYIGQTLDAFAILGAVSLSVIFGFYLEAKADRSMEALRRMVSHNTVVARGGKKEVVPVEGIVPGDVIFLEEGARIPADARVIESFGLEANESSLTGESMPVAKHAGASDAEAPLAERGSMLYAGCLIAKGNGTALVVATGNHTEFGKIAESLAEVEEEKTTLQRTLDDLSRKLSILAVAVIVILVGVGLMQGRELADLFMLAVALAVAAVPEGLMTVLTIILAMGVRTMAEHKALVRKISAVETLGWVSAIATDKTGTLTEGKMALRRVYTSGRSFASGEIPDNNPIMRLSALCTTAQVTGHGIVGDEMDKAVLEAASASMDVAELKKTEQVALFPLDSEKKRMITAYALDGADVTIMKGAPEIVLQNCISIYEDGKVRKITYADVQAAETEHHALASKGMRLLGIGYRKMERKDETEEELERNLVFLGLLAFEDPPRKESAETIRTAKDAGINVVMVTGDNKVTATAIGKEMGLLEKRDEVIEWKDLQNLKPAEMGERLGEVKIVARSTPVGKLIVVDALMSKGEIVAVTGDGVNDAPALKKANVGVVMGQAGTEVSKESADVVLMDDNLATLVKAIEYGRNIYRNIRGFVRFQVTTSVAALMMFFGAFFMGFPDPLTPIQILFVNILMDGPPALALGLERPSSSVMKDRPKRFRSILDRRMLMDIGITALFMAVVALLVFSHYMGSAGERMAVTATFTLFVLLQLFNALNCRGNGKPFSVSGNPWLFATLLVMLAVQLAIVYLGPAEELFRTSPLGTQDLGLVAAVAVLILPFEVLKRKILDAIPEPA